MLVLCCLDERKMESLSKLVPIFVELQYVSILNVSLIRSTQPDAIITQTSFFSPAVLDRICALMESSRILLLGAREDSYDSIAALARRGILYSHHMSKKSIGTFLLSCSRIDATAENDDGGDLGIIGSSSCMREIRRNILCFGPLQDTVIICGKTGSGKDITARALHRCSGRTGTFLPINCSAIPETLIESEIFGSVKGAFTGADKDSSGYLRAADKGTLFLDEIGDMPVFMQTKLLRVLEDKRVTPLGSTRSFSVDVRFITATSRNIQKLISKGKFRKDLYYRLNVLKIRVPTLAERKSDIPQLVSFFLAENNSRKSFSTAAMMKLLDHPWPGNIRELKTIIRRAEILSGDRTIIEEQHVTFQ
jgi:transcriptional regulator with PAS, ATPase and Fis domain